MSAPLYREGVTLDEMRKRVDTAQSRQRIAKDDAFVGANLDVAIASAVERAWQEARGELAPEGLPPVEG